MEVQVKLPNVDKPYSYDCINGGNTGDTVVILEGRLTGRKGLICAIGRGNYAGRLFQCWRPEFDESLVEEWCRNATDIDEQCCDRHDYRTLLSANTTKLAPNGGNKNADVDRYRPSVTRTRADLATHGTLREMRAPYR
jgi:hypothetical protein